MKNLETGGEKQLEGYSPEELREAEKEAGLKEEAAEEALRGIEKIGEDDDTAKKTEEAVDKIME